MTDTHLERQLRFEGMDENDIKSIKPVLSISLAQRDAELRATQNVSSKNIESYHVEVYEKLGLPIYTWSGLVITKVGGDAVWNAALNDNAVFKETIKNIFDITKNISKDFIGEYSVARMKSSFADAIECSVPGLKAFCPTEYGETEFSIEADPYEALSKKWGVTKSQIVKKINSEISPNNRDLYFIKDNEYYIVSKRKTTQSDDAIGEIKKISEEYINRLKEHVGKIEIEQNKRKADLNKIETGFNAVALERERENNIASANAKLQAAAQKAQNKVATETAADKAAATAARRDGSNAHIVARVQAEYDQECAQIDAEFQSKKAAIDRKLDELQRALADQLKLFKNQEFNKDACAKFYKLVADLLKQMIQQIKANENFDASNFKKLIEKEFNNTVAALKSI